MRRAANSPATMIVPRMRHGCQYTYRQPPPASRLSTWFSRETKTRPAMHSTRGSSSSIPVNIVSVGAAGKE